MDYLKDYNLLKSQKYISNQDFQVRVVHNIFSKNQIDHIYNIVDNTPEENTHLQTWAGHRAWNVTFGPEIEKTITNAAQSILGDNQRSHLFVRLTLAVVATPQARSQLATKAEDISAPIA